MVKFGILISCCFMLSGCVLAPFIDSYKQAGVSKADREVLLDKSVQEFHQALYWGSMREALAYTDDESRNNLREMMRNRRDTEKLVESQVEYVDFSDDAFSADVDVIVRYYEIPVYIVQKRLETQQWIFSYTGGWKFRRVIDTKKIPA